MTSSITFTAEGALTLGRGLQGCGASEKGVGSGCVPTDPIIDISFPFEESGLT